MIKYRWPLTIVTLAALALTGCLARPTASASDTVETAVAEAAFRLLTETAAAASPTPQPPTPTMTASYTDTPTAEPTTTAEFRNPLTVNFAGCGLGGPESAGYAHETSIKKGKAVELLGVGSVDGYFVIRDPYFHRPCWILGTDLKIFEGTDWSLYPVMTPGVPAQGQ